MASTHLGPRLLPLQLISACLHGWMAIFLPSRSVASLPPGVTAYLASLVLCLTLHPAISSLMSRSAKLNTLRLLPNANQAFFPEFACQLKASLAIFTPFSPSVDYVHNVTSI